MHEFSCKNPVRVSTIGRLRQATDALHTRLHEHPLMVELLERPSTTCYKTVLLGFLRFYNALEPQLVRDAQSLGCANLYPRTERLEWLSADLKTLDGEVRLPGRMGNDEVTCESATIGGLVGRLYVVRGSALGGRSILRVLRDAMDIDHCCQFFDAGGPEVVANRWGCFQTFCEQACTCEASKAVAVLSARRAFEQVEQCFA